VLVIKIQHANPFYDDSYAVNSANLGPYGDAIETELIPAIEKQFRGIGQGWARFLYGGSTGGWESLAVQMFYPDDYNGAFVACPDPVDFHAYMTATSTSTTTCSTAGREQAGGAARHARLPRPHADLHARQHRV
jgi:enterochelin esterase-like enzyme